jgi:hypothetical protein
MIHIQLPKQKPNKDTPINPQIDAIWLNDETQNFKTTIQQGQNQVNYTKLK